MTCQRTAPVQCGCWGCATGIHWINWRRYAPMLLHALGLRIAGVSLRSAVHSWPRTRDGAACCDVARWFWDRHSSSCTWVGIGDGLQRRGLVHFLMWRFRVLTGFCSSFRDPNYLKIINLFEDNRKSGFSLRQIALMGNSEDKKVGQWFGPNTVAQVLKWVIYSLSLLRSLNEHFEPQIFCLLLENSCATRNGAI